MANVAAWNDLFYNESPLPETVEVLGYHYRGHSYLGRYALGDQVPLLVQVTDALGRPEWPDQNPLVLIYQEGHLVRNRVLAAHPESRVGFFGVQEAMGALYGRGQCSALISWSYAGVVELMTVSWECIGGGDPGGAILAMAVLERPEAVSLVAQLDTGVLVYGRNPRI